MTTIPATEIETARAELAHTTSEAQQGLRLVEELQIHNEEDQTFAGAVLQDVKTSINALEGRRKEITGPLNQALSSVNALFRGPRTTLERIEKVLKGKIADYQARQLLAQRAAVQAAAQAPTPAQAHTALVTMPEPVAPPQGVSVRYTWKATVVDWRALLESELKDPRGYVGPNMAAINAAAPGPVPGVTFEKVPIVAVRAK